MSEVYGAGSGITQGIQDLHNMALTGLQSAEAQRAQEGLRQDQLANQVFANMPKVGSAPTGPATPNQDPNLAMADRMTSYASALMDAGLPQKAMDVSAKSATLRHTTVLAQKDQIETHLKQQEEVIGQLKQGAAVAQRAMAQAGGDNQMAFELAKQMALQQHPELAQDQEFMSHQYQPGYLTGLVESAVGADKYLEHVRNTAKDALDKRVKEQTIKTNKAREDILRKRVEDIDLKMSAARKNGGSSASVEALRQARIAAIKEGYLGKTADTAIPALNDPEQLKDSRYYISPTGAVGRWNAKTKTFTPVAKSEFESSPRASDSADDIEMGAESE